MAVFDPMTILFLVGVSLAAGGFSATFANLLARRDSGPSHVMLRGLALPLSYVFRDGYLISDLGETDALLTDPTDRVAAWGELKEALSALNPDVAARMEALRQSGDAFVLIGRIGEDELSLSGRMSEGRCFVTVASLEPGRDRRMIDQAGLDALEGEVDLLRHGLDASRDLLWQEDDRGQIIWANRAYFELLQSIDAEEDRLVWPIPKLFPEPSEPAPQDGQARRMSLEMPGGARPVWIEITARDFRRGRLLTGRRIDRVVAAETALRDFVQTLSRTFAHLPIGLAIFDKRRELVLFNPALVSLSTLPGDWLSGRPDLFSFLDRLREKQRMPEPKDYQAWRASLGELEQAAKNGTFQEMWSLPNGQTFRVIGRPHADGAVAFLFEDISQEVTLTRKFRGDLDLYQAVVDDVDEALCVFGRDGRAVLANAAYRALWPEAAGAASVAEASRSWQAACDPTPLWGEIRDFVGGYSDRSAWTDRVLLMDGRCLVCRIAPLRGGASLIGFREQALPQVTGGTPGQSALVSAS
jgi:PAS domain-containing protein